MGKIFYSSITNSFYDDAIHETMPEDAVEITQERHQELLAGQDQWTCIGADENGFPVLQDRVFTADDLCINERRWRNRELARADIELYKAQDGMGVGTPAAWQEYRCALRALPEHPQFPSAEARPVAPDQAAT